MRSLPLLAPGHACLGLQNSQSVGYAWVGQVKYICPDGREFAGQKNRSETGRSDGQKRDGQKRAGQKRGPKLGAEARWAQAWCRSELVPKLAEAKRGAEAMKRAACCGSGVTGSGSSLWLRLRLL